MAEGNNLRGLGFKWLNNYIYTFAFSINYVGLRNIEYTAIVI